MSYYAEIEYWNERYQNQPKKTYEWLFKWSEVKELIEKECVKGIYEGGKIVDDEKAKDIRRTYQVLHLGIGNSEMSEEMYDDGYTQCNVNNDLSFVCINQMRNRNKELRP